MHSEHLPLTTSAARTVREAKDRALTGREKFFLDGNTLVSIEKDKLGRACLLRLGTYTGPEAARRGLNAAIGTYDGTRKVEALGIDAEAKMPVRH